MTYINCYTLIDITPTGIIRGESVERDQQRNWQTVLQVLSLKTQPDIIQGPTIFEVDDISSTSFGEFYQGTQLVWAFQFKGERPEFYDIDSLKQDFDQVPIILGLNETARFMLPIFHTAGALKNIYFLPTDQR